jgi:Fe(3+) dicitrate transport protein
VRTDPSFILDVTGRVVATERGQFYVSIRNLLGAEDIAARLPFGARPVAPRMIQVGTKWMF